MRRLSLPCLALALSLLLSTGGLGAACCEGCFAASSMGSCADVAAGMRAAGCHEGAAMNGSCPSSLGAPPATKTAVASVKVEPLAGPIGQVSAPHRPSLALIGSTAGAPSESPWLGGLDRSTLFSSLLL